MPAAPGSGSLSGLPRNHRRPPRRLRQQHPARRPADRVAGRGSQPVTLTLYSGQHEQTTHALVTAFERQTGINVKDRHGDEDVLAQQIEQEGSSSPADVFYTENSPPLMSLQDKGLLSPVPAATLAQVPAQYNSPQGDWVGVSARVSVLVYNTAPLSPAHLPTSVMDLADPKWKGKLASPPARPTSSPS